MKLFLATNNKNKIREIRNKFSSLGGLRIITPEEKGVDLEVAEDGATFRENALLKARAFARHTGLPSLADDSGLEIDALGGEPGVYSARYAGDGASDLDRNLLILEKMKGIPDERRGARFVCVIAIAFPDGGEHAAMGTCEGRIATELRGDGGFGYDPIFLLPGGSSMAEIPLEEKNRISHRARALDVAAELLGRIMEERKDH